MSIIDQISAEEKEMMVQYIEKYALGGSSMKAPIEHILRYWAEAKENSGLYQLLNNQLVISKSFCVEKDKSAITKELAELTEYGEGQTFVDRIYDAVANRDGVSKAFDIISIFRTDNLIDNKYTGQPLVLWQKDDKPFHINPGIKTMKAIKKIAETYDIPNFEEFRIRHSQILNEKYLKGTVYLSIHPFDYMTMSDNDCNWSSCMHWPDEGDYRLGTVEMMNSPFVVEAYTAPLEWNFNPVGDCCWNNKHWRELFIVNSDMVFGVKGYPYWNRPLEAMVLTWIKELAEKNLGWTYNNELQKVNYKSCHTSWYMNEKKYRVTFTTDHMYNDIYSEHYGYFNPEMEQDRYVHYSGYAECMSCGDIIDDSDHPHNALACDDCKPYRYCSECGRMIREGEEVFIVDGYEYCEDCYYNLPSDDITGEIHSPNCMTEVLLGYHNTPVKHDESQSRFYTSRKYYLYIHYDVYDDLKEQGLIHSSPEYTGFELINIEDLNRDTVYDLLDRYYHLENDLIKLGFTEDEIHN